MEGREALGLRQETGCPGERTPEPGYLRQQYKPPKSEPKTFQKSEYKKTQRAGNHSKSLFRVEHLVHHELLPPNWQQTQGAAGF